MTIDNEASVKPTIQFINDTISTLHHQGLSITESIKVLMLNYQISLHDTKSLVSQHPVWHTVTTAAEPLHQEIVSVLENLEKAHSEKTQRVNRTAFRSKFILLLAVKRMVLTFIFFCPVHSSKN